MSGPLARVQRLVGTGRSLVHSFSDVLASGYIPRDISILRAELMVSHRVRSRRFLLNYIPENSVGAELGVFTGLLSSLLAKERKIAHITFVDPWWKAFDEYYPDWWGKYTDYGRVKTRSAYEVANRRISCAGLPGRVVEVATSNDWLDAQPNESLDWVYIDSTHTYEGTLQELKLLNRKLKGNGLILGDDWWMDRSNVNHGVFLAVNKFLKANNFEVVFCGIEFQWMLRRSCDGASWEAEHDTESARRNADWVSRHRDKN